MAATRQTEHSSPVRAWSEEVVIPTYVPAAPDKNPMFLEKRVYQGSSGKVYPLPFTDRIAEKKTDRRWKVVWIENEFLRVMVLPELGGRIHRILDKTNGYDLIYFQPVIKPALVGLAGPWVSGGIEFNWPQHHRPATFLPVDFQIEEHTDGSKTIWCGDHDPMCRMKGMHGVCLHAGRAALELKVRVSNRTPLTQTFLWWANVATRVHAAYQSFFPPDVHCVADHARRSMSEYPLAKSFYYGVNYGERGQKGIPANEIPSQFVPPYAAAKSENRNPDAEPNPKLEIRNANESRISDLPNYAANDLSWYANIPTPCSYMCIGSKHDFFGGYDHRVQAGIVHVANHHISPGKKQWTWGNHPFGYAWDRHLTDADERGEFAPYIELMAGVYTDNQPDFSFLAPGETKSWSQFWYPIQKIGPAQHANVDAAVSLRIDAKRTRIGVSASSIFEGAVIRLERKRGAALEWTANLAPGKPFVVETKQSPRKWTERDSTLRVLARDGREIISYSPRPRGKVEVPPPATEPLAPQNVSSTDELFITGLHLEQYRHATRCPTLYWREALRCDPLDSRCNNALGLWHLRRGEFALAESHFRKALERLTQRNANPYDGEPFYNLGLLLRHLGRDDEAYDAFYKATWNQAWGGAGFHALAEIDCAREHWTDANDHLARSLRLNGDNLRARNLRVIVLRRLGRDVEAQVLLREMLADDPLDWWAKHLNGEPLRCDYQTQLDIAHDYARAGLFAEVVQWLSASAEQAMGSSPSPQPSPSERGSHVPQLTEKSGADFLTTTQSFLPLPKGDVRGEEERSATVAGAQLPNQSWGALPLVHYTLGWLHEKLGDAKAARHCCDRAAAESPDYCFPSRLEEIAVLEAGMRANPRDARAPYYLGNLLYDRRRHDEAIRLWERSATLDPGFSVVWRNLGIGYFNVRGQPARARAAYGLALKANPRDARLLYERDQLWKRTGESPARRLRELARRLDLVGQRDDLSIELCALYNQTGRPAKALDVLRARRFQPWEGGEGQALAQHVRTHLALGREAFAREDFPQARERFEQALTSPENLGEAKHLLANQSDIHYWLGCTLEQLGDVESAREHWRAAATCKGDFQEMSVRAFSEMTYYSALSWEKLGRRSAAKKLLRELLAHAQKLAKAPAKIDYFATSLPTMLLFDDDLQQRQTTTALLLEAQARLGLGQRARAAALLRNVLKRDPNHPLARDLSRELRA